MVVNYFLRFSVMVLVGAPRPALICPYQGKAAPSPRPPGDWLLILTQASAQLCQGRKMLL